MESDIAALRGWSSLLQKTIFHGPVGDRHNCKLATNAKGKAKLHPSHWITELDLVGSKGTGTSGRAYSGRSDPSPSGDALSFAPALVRG